MCFVAEKDAHRRNAVFDDVDTKNGAWTDLVNAALKPVNAAIEAAKKSTSAADGKTRARAARELRCARARARAHALDCCAHSLRQRRLTWRPISDVAFRLGYAARNSSSPFGAYARLRRLVLRRHRATASGWRRSGRQPWEKCCHACLLCTVVRGLSCSMRTMLLHARD
jgi:hypothetical protein